MKTILPLVIAFLMIGGLTHVNVSEDFDNSVNCEVINAMMKSISKDYLALDILFCDYFFLQTC